MAGRGRRFRGPSIAFNFTPLIDVMMLLTIFFMLVARFTTSEHLPLELPRPKESLAQSQKLPDRVIINCRPLDPQRADGGVVYSIGPNDPEGLADISEHLRLLKRSSPNPSVLIRADRRLGYGAVRALLRVVAENDIPVLNVAAIVGENG